METQASILLPAIAEATSQASCRRYLPKNRHFFAVTLAQSLLNNHWKILRSHRLQVFVANRWYLQRSHTHRNSISGRQVGEYSTTATWTLIYSRQKL